MKQEERKTLIRNGRVIDPHKGLDDELDVLIEGSEIQAVDAPGQFEGVTEAEIVDASGCYVVPGLTDIHVHLRDPGLEWKETIETGTAVAVAGGYTTVCCMPNTKPVNDCASVTRHIISKADAVGLCHVCPVGAITVESKGTALAPMLEMHESGCVAFSDDGYPVYNAGIMRRALEYVSMFGGVLTVHEEDRDLSNNFAMNESVLSLKLGLVGMPDAAENVMIARDIEIARLTGGRVHFSHVSNARGVELIRRAKSDGISVSAETVPHYFTLDESAIGDYNTNAKMSMPLRSRADCEALIAGLEDGTLDCISSDHAPHEADSKNIEFDKASFGIIGLQTTVPLTFALVREGKLSVNRAIELLSSAPLKCYGMSPGTVSVGQKADLTLIDPEKKIRFTTEISRSKSQNSPFLGWELQGHAVKTFVDGKQVYDISELGEV